VGQGKEELHSYTAGCLSSVAVAMIGSAEGGWGAYTLTTNFIIEGIDSKNISLF